MNERGARKEGEGEGTYYVRGAQGEMEVGGHWI